MKPFLYGILAILLFSIPLSADSASSLNQEGLDLYRAGKFGPALQKFEKAVEVKPDYAWGHYNLACTLGVIRKKGDICEHNAYKGRIVEHLTKAVKLLPRLKNKFRNDPDLKPIHDTIGYRKLLGYSLLNPRHLNHFIRHVSWFGPAPGAYGHISGISFGKKSSVSFWYLDISGKSGIPKRKQISGWYHLQGTKIIINLKRKFRGRKAFTGGISGNGLLTIEGLSGPFRDIPDECSA